MESSTACPVCTLYLREGISLYDHLDTHPKDQVIEALIRIRERDEPIAPGPSQPLLSIPTSQSAPYYQSPQPCYPVQQYPPNSYGYQQMALMGTSSLPPHLGPVAMVSAPNPSLMQVMYNPYMLPQQNIHLLSPAGGPSAVAAAAAPASPGPSEPLLTVPKVTTTTHLTSESVQTNLSTDSTPFHLHAPTVESRKRQSPPASGFVPPPAQIVRPVATYDETRVEYHDVEEPITSRAEDSPCRAAAEFVQTESIRRVRFVQYKLSSERIARSSRETAETCVVETEKEWVASPHFTPSGGLRELVGEKLAATEPPPASTAAPTRSKRARTRGPRTRGKPPAPEPTTYVDTEFYLSQPGSSRLEPMACADGADCGTGVKMDRSDDEEDHKVDLLLSREPDPAAPVHSEDPAFRRHEPDEPGFHGHESEEPSFRELSTHEAEDPTFRRLSEHEAEDSTFRRLSVHEAEDPTFRRLSVHEAEDPTFRRLSEHEAEDPTFRRLSEHEAEDPDFRRLSVPEAEDPLEVRTAVDSIIMPREAEEYITSDCPFGARKDADSEAPGAEFVARFVGEFRDPRAVEVLAYPENSHGADAYPAHAALEAGIKPKVLKQQIDDLNVSTSYEVLAREGWAVSDGSDTEVTAPARQPAPWADPGAASAKRQYKCTLCGETFNCPKERRVHRSAFHAAAAAKPKVDDAPPEPAAEPPPPLPLKTERVRAPRAAKKKRVVKAVQVLVVQSATDKFTGVFVKEDAADADPMDAEDIKKEAVAEPPVAGGSVAKRAVRAKPAVARAARAGPYKCSSCPLQFALRKKYVTHVQKEHKSSMSLKNPYICNICQEVFTNDRRYSEHLQKHPLECKTCCKVFHKRQNLVLHMRRHLGIKPYPCTMCAKSFITKQKLTEHRNVHLGLAPIKCTLCTMSFRRYSNLIQHKNRFHYMIKKKVKDYVCFCGEIYHSKKKLEWHKEIHEKKPKCCKFCSERFVHTASLTRHIRRAHDRRYMPKVGRETENVECAVCGHVFLKSSLPVHMRLHTGERPYSCSVCGKTFTTKWNLQQHRWTHMSRSSKPYKCSQCKSAFARESDYSQHMDSHSNKRPYTCNVCGLQFVRKNNCIRHAKEHQAVKTFTCKVCNKTFHRGYYLKDHMMVHSGARPFTCHICGKASSTKSNHNKHVKIHHAREPVNTEA